MRRVVITGLGAITPLGKTVPDNWEAATSGKSGVGMITAFDTTQYTSRIAGEVLDFQPLPFLSVKDVRKMERFIQFAMVAAAEALSQSGLDLNAEDAEKIGSYVGVGMGGLIEIQNQYREIMERGPRRVSPFFIPSVITNLAAGQISLKYGLKGPNLCTTSACSSSAHAIGESYRLIQRGDVDVMISGGAEAVVCELGVAGFCAMRALSQRNDEPQKASRPFDKDRDGFVMGEGAAILLLEELEHAKRRGATIIAEVSGYGLNSDAYHMTQPSPEGEGAARCMALALKDGGLSADRIDYVNAHGTSTPIGDVNEILAVKKVFGSHAQKIAVSSTKSMTGHLLGAAGALEALFSVLAIKHDLIPPTINLDNPSPECDLNLVPHTAQERTVRAALSNSFGFGGTNASLVFKKMA